MATTRKPLFSTAPVELPEVTISLLWHASYDSDSGQPGCETVARAG